MLLLLLRREHPQLTASASQVPWALDDGVTGALPDGDYLMSGNPISVRSLDLSREFEDIRQQLDSVAVEWF